MRKLLNAIIKIGFPILLAAGILWWMYRGYDWDKVLNYLRGDMSWTWMLLSMPFGISAQLFRALRWRQVLAPMGERPRLHTCINAIFLSYASSLIIPRVGEFLRCGVLTRYESTNFSRGVGTVVTERVVDTVMVMLLAFFTILTQIPVFLVFFHNTGVSLGGFLSTFTSTGYLVTFICLIVLVIGLGILIYRFHFFSRTKAVLTDLKEGLLSVRLIKRPVLFFLYSIGIWASYYLHFYVTFYCFDFTSHLGPITALVAFVVGTFAVLVPTPNGAGPWHFAVKTILVLFGVSQLDGAAFVFIVFFLQTLLVALLGVYSIIALACTRPRSQASNNPVNENISR